MTLDEARAAVGRTVVYKSGWQPVQEGVITSVNDRWVFVRYSVNGTPQATAPENLTLPGAP